MANINKPGYTLLELLIAITIFSALIIVSVGIFARTVTSSAKSNVSRQKTEAARSVIDQISNDFRYVLNTQTPFDCNKFPPTTGTWRGFCVDSIGDALYMLIKYPGDSTYTAKAYTVNATSTDAQISVLQQRGCTDATTCSISTSTPSSLLGSAYSFDASQIFSGTADILDTTNSVNPTAIITKGSLSISLAIKPAGLGKLCSELDAGTCYQLSTTLVPGGFQ